MDIQLRKFLLRIYDRRWEVLFAVVLLVFVSVFVFGLLGWLYYTSFIDPSFSPHLGVSP